MTHCLGAFAEGTQVINVTVEAGAFCGYGLAQHAKLTRPVALGQPVAWNDVEVDQGSAAYALVREIESEIETASI